MINNNTGMSSKEVNVPAEVGTFTTSISFPYEIGILRAKWFNKTTFGGDSVAVKIAPNTPIGVVVVEALEGSNTITCSSTVINNINIGYEVLINGQSLGAVIGIDTTNSTITTEIALNSTATVGSYVLQTINVVPFLYLDEVDSMMVLEGDDEYLLLPPNVPIVIYYTNNNGLAKTYSVKLEYKY